MFRAATTRPRRASPPRTRRTGSARTSRWTTTASRRRLLPACRWGKGPSRMGSRPRPSWSCFRARSPPSLCLRRVARRKDTSSFARQTITIECRGVLAWLAQDTSRTEAVHGYSMKFKSKRYGRPLPSTPCLAVRCALTASAATCAHDQWLSVAVGLRPHRRRPRHLRSPRANCD